jgi:hypothetical protein
LDDPERLLCSTQVNLTMPTDALSKIAAGHPINRFAELMPWL